jgi:MFS family permease
VDRHRGRGPHLDGARRRGHSPAVVGLGVIVEAALRALASPFAGTWSDRRGRKPVMLAGLVLTGFSIPSYAVVGDAASYIAVQAFSGFASSLYGPASQALLADATAKADRTGVFGVLHTARNVGWTFGIALAAVFAAAPPTTLFLAAGAAPLLLAPVVLAPVRDVRAPSGARGLPFRDWSRVLAAPRFGLFLASATVFYVEWGMFHDVLPLFLSEGMAMPRQAFVLLFAINPALIMLLQAPFGIRASRMSRTGVLASAAWLAAATYVAFAYAARAGPGGEGTLLAAAGVLLITFAEILFSPVLPSLTAELAPADAVGSAMGLVSLSAALGHGLGPALADRALALGRWHVASVAFAALTLAAFAGALVLRSRLSPEEDRPGTVAEAAARPRL